MKKLISILIFCMIAILFPSSSFAGGSGNFIQKDEKIEVFGAYLNISQRVVNTYWNQYEGEEGFANYIILRSQDREKLNYPTDDEVTRLWFTADKTISSYVDENPLEGKTWYKLCTVTKEGTFTDDGRINLNVRCSDEMYVINDPDDNRTCLGMLQTEQYALNDDTGECKRYENPCDIPETNWTAIKNWKETPACQDTNNEGVTEETENNQESKPKLDKKTQKKIDTLLEKFFSKIEKKYSDNSKRQTVLKGLIAKLETIKKKIKKESTIDIVDYLIEVIEERIDLYDEYDYSDIEELLEDY